MMLPNFARRWKMLAALLGCTFVCLIALAQAPPPGLLWLMRRLGIRVM